MNDSEYTPLGWGKYRVFREWASGEIWVATLHITTGPFISIPCKWLMSAALPAESTSANISSQYQQSFILITGIAVHIIPVFGRTRMPFCLNTMGGDPSRWAGRAVMPRPRSDFAIIVMQQFCIELSCE